MVNTIYDSHRDRSHITAHRDIIPKSKISGIFVEYRKDLHSNVVTINI